MVGKTLRVTPASVHQAVNTICGYIVVEAETAAHLFEAHPHVTTFPGSGVHIMPFVTEPKARPFRRQKDRSIFRQHGWRCASPGLRLTP